MSLHPIVLQTDKTITDFTKDFETLKQSEKGQVLEGQILNADKEPYDLSASGIYLAFCEQKAEGKMIIDKGNGQDTDDTAGKMTITDAKNGKFTYKLCSQVYAVSGDAWIEIYQGNTFVDATESFHINVEQSAQIHYENDNYISDMANILTSLKAEFTRAQSSVNTLTSRLQGQVDDANSNLNKQLQDMQKSVQHYQDLYTKIQTNYDNAMKGVTDQATKDTQTAINNINNRYTADMNTLKTNFSDWQTQTINDFNKQAQDILAKVTQNGKDVTAVQKQVQDTVTKMQDLQKQFSSIDFTKFVTGDQIQNYYTKTQVDQKLASAGKVKTVNKNQPDSNGNINVDTGVTSFNGSKGDVTFKVNHTGYSSPQAAFDASKNGDGIYIYDPDDGPTSAVIDGQTITVSGNHDLIVSLQQQMSSLSSSKANQSDITNISNQLNSKANATDLTSLANRVSALENKKPIKAASQSDAVSKSADGNWYYW